MVTARTLYGLAHNHMHSGKSCGIHGAGATRQGQRPHASTSNLAPNGLTGCAIHSPLGPRHAQGSIILTKSLCVLCVPCASCACLHNFYSLTRLTNKVTSGSWLCHEATSTDKTAAWQNGSDLRHGRLACTRSLERRTAGCVLFVTYYLLPRLNARYAESRAASTRSPAASHGRQPRALRARTRSSTRPLESRALRPPRGSSRAAAESRG